MQVQDVIIRPLVTEKSTHQSQVSHEATQRQPSRGGSYAFEVHPEAQKSQIRQAVEALYHVKVRSVRTMNRKGKRRRYRFKIGTTPHWKKAVVVLHAEHHIDLF